MQEPGRRGGFFFELASSSPCLAVLAAGAMAGSDGAWRTEAAEFLNSAEALGELSSGRFHSTLSTRPPVEREAVKRGVAGSLSSEGSGARGLLRLLGEGSGKGREWLLKGVARSAAASVAELGVRSLGDEVEACLSKALVSESGSDLADALAEEGDFLVESLSLKRLSPQARDRVASRIFSFPAQRLRGAMQVCGQALWSGGRWRGLRLSSPVFAEAVQAARGVEGFSEKAAWKEWGESARNCQEVLRLAQAMGFFEGAGAFECRSDMHPSARQSGRSSSWWLFKSLSPVGMMVSVSTRAERVGGDLFGTISRLDPRWLGVPALCLDSGSGSSHVLSGAVAALIFGLPDGSSGAGLGHVAQEEAKRVLPFLPKGIEGRLAWSSQEARALLEEASMLSHGDSSAAGGASMGSTPAPSV